MNWRIELLRTKAELSMARVSLQRAEFDVGRHGALHLEKLVSEDMCELAMTTRVTSSGPKWRPRATP